MSMCSCATAAAACASPTRASGLKPTGDGLGTGLSTLRERLQLAFGGDAQLRLTEIEPHGVCAELEFPARQEPA